MREMGEEEEGGGWGVGFGFGAPVGLGPGGPRGGLLGWREKERREGKKHGGGPRGQAAGWATWPGRWAGVSPYFFLHKVFSYFSVLFQTVL